MASTAIAVNVERVGASVAPFPGVLAGVFVRGLLVAVVPAADPDALPTSPAAGPEPEPEALTEPADPDLPQRCIRESITFAYKRTGPTVHSFGATCFTESIAFMHASLLQTALICASVGDAMDVGLYPESVRHVLTFAVTSSFDIAVVSHGGAAAAIPSKAATAFRIRMTPSGIIILYQRKPRTKKNGSVRKARERRVLRRSHACHRHTRSRSESPWSRNVRPRRSRHDRSRSPQLDCRRDRSRGRNYGEHYDYGGPRRHVDVFDYYDSDSFEDRGHSSRSRSRPRHHEDTRGYQRSSHHRRDHSTRSRSRSRYDYRDQERSGRSRSKARHYGGDNHTRGRSDAPRHRSRSRHHVVPPDHRERGRSVVTRSHSRARSSAGDRSSVQTPSSAASAALSTEVGPADDEWIGSSQPLTTSVEDLFLCGSIPLSNRSGAGNSGRAQNLKSNCYQVTLDAAKCQRIFQYNQCIELGGDATPERNTNPGNQLSGGHRLTRTLLRQVVLDAIQQHPDTFGGVIVVRDRANALFSASALPVPDDGVTLNVRSSARNSYGIDPPDVSKGKTRPYTVHVKLAEELETSLLGKAFSDPALDVDPLVYALDAVAKAGLIGR